LWNRFSFVHFKNADACRKAHDKGEGLKVRGRTIMVVYARRKTEPQSRSKPAEQVKGLNNELLLVFLCSVLSCSVHCY